MPADDALAVDTFLYSTQSKSDLIEIGTIKSRCFLENALFPPFDIDSMLRQKNIAEFLNYKFLELRKVF